MLGKTEKSKENQIFQGHSLVNDTIYRKEARSLSDLVEFEQTEEVE